MGPHPAVNTQLRWAPLCFVGQFASPSGGPGQDIDASVLASENGGMPKM